MGAEVTTFVTILGALGGLSSVIVSMLYFRENKKRKVAENKAIDIKSLTDTINILQKDKEAMHKDVKQMREEIDTLKHSLRVSDSEKIGIERELNIHKRAIGCRVLCNAKECPIEVQLITLKIDSKTLA